MSGIYSPVLVYAATNIVQPVAVAHKAQLLVTQKLFDQRELRLAQNNPGAQPVLPNRASNARAIQNQIYQQFISSATARTAAQNGLNQSLTAQTAITAQLIGQQKTKRAPSAVDFKVSPVISGAAKAYQAAHAISPTANRTLSGSGLVILDRVTKIDVVV